MQTWKLNFHYYFNIISKLQIHNIMTFLHFVSSVIQYDGCWFYICFNCGIYHAGQKFREVFQLQHGSYSALPASKISEMMHSKSLDVSSSRILPIVIELCYLVVWYPVLTVVISHRMHRRSHLLVLLMAFWMKALKGKRERYHMYVILTTSHPFYWWLFTTMHYFDLFLSACSLLTEEGRSGDWASSLYAGRAHKKRKKISMKHSFPIWPHNFSPELDILFCSKILSSRQEKRNTVQKLKHLKYW